MMNLQRLHLDLFGDLIWGPKDDIEKLYEGICLKWSRCLEMHQAPGWQEDINRTNLIIVWSYLDVYYDRIWHGMVWYDMFWYDMIWYDMIWYDRRKFRSLTSDNMQSWKSRVEMSSQQKEDQHACRVTRKKVHVRKMLGTSRIAVFFQWFVFPDVRKVASLKRRVRR